MKMGRRKFITGAAVALALMQPFAADASRWQLLMHGQARLPVATNWRATFNSVYASLGGTAITDALTAGPTTKADALYSVAASTTLVVGFEAANFGTVGGIFYVNPTGAANPLTLTSEYSDTATNYTSGSWTDMGLGLWHPVGDTSSGANSGRGHAIPLPGVAGRKYRFTFVNGDGAVSCSMDIGVRTLNIPGYRADIVATAGNSIYNRTCDPRSMATQIKALYPTYDPLWLNIARSNATVSQCYDEVIVDGITHYGSILGCFIGDMACGGTISAGHPWSTDTTGRATISTYLTSAFDYCDAHHIPLYLGPVNYRNYGIDGNNLPAVNGTANQENGTSPYDNNEIMAIARARSPKTFDTATGMYRLDTYTYVMDILETGLDPDGIHLNGAGITRHTSEVAKAIGYAWYDKAPPLSYMERLIAIVEAAGGNTTVAYKARLQADFDALPVADAGPQTTARAALQARITAITTGYSDPALTGGAILPQNVSGAIFYFDGADYDKIYSDAGVTAITDGGSVQRITDRINSYTMSQASGLSKPIWHASGMGLGAYMSADGNDYLAADDAALIAFGNTAASAFWVAWVERSSTTGAKDILGFGAGATNNFFAGQQSGQTAFRYQVLATSVVNESLSPAKTSGAVYAYVAVWSGTQLTLYRSDGLTTGPTTKTKTDMVNTAFRWFGRANTATWIGDGGMIAGGSGVPSGTEITNLINGLKQKYGAT